MNYLYAVLVIEKGEFYSAEQIAKQSEADALENLYVNSGAVLSEDYSIGTFAGSNVGGGSTVNWSASFKLPYNVREEWATKHGLDVFTSKRYQDALDVVTDRIGVSTVGVEHNVANQILADGCEK
jgi:long-chain-alcohol oxidase